MAPAPGEENKVFCDLSAATNLCATTQSKCAFGKKCACRKSLQQPLWAQHCPGNAASLARGVKAQEKKKKRDEAAVSWCGFILKAGCGCNPYLKKAQATKVGLNPHCHAQQQRLKQMLGQGNDKKRKQR